MSAPKKIRVNGQIYVRASVPSKLSSLEQIASWTQKTIVSVLKASKLKYSFKMKSGKSRVNYKILIADDQKKAEKIADKLTTLINSQTGTGAKAYAAVEVPYEWIKIKGGQLALRIYAEAWTRDFMLARLKLIVKRYGLNVAKKFVLKNYKESPSAYPELFES